VSTRNYALLLAAPTHRKAADPFHTDLKGKSISITFTHHPLPSYVLSTGDSPSEVIRESIIYECGPGGRTFVCCSFYKL